MKRIDLYSQIFLTFLLAAFDAYLLNNLYSVIGVHLGVVLGLSSLILEAFCKHKCPMWLSKYRPFFHRSVTFILCILTFMAWVQFGGLL